MSMILKQIFPNIGIIIVGIISGSIVNMIIIVLGSFIFPLSENLEPMNALNWNFKYFIFPFLAHSFGTFLGSYFVSKLSKSNIIFSLIIGIYFLFGGIYMVQILPAPMWFISVDLLLCYIPMSLLGWKISSK